MEALACGLPLVTVPGPFMRARVTAAILRHIGIPELIGRDEDDYVAIASRLGTDIQWRRAIREKIRRRRGRAYDDEAPVVALAEVFERLVRERSDT